MPSAIVLVLVVVLVLDCEGVLRPERTEIPQGSNRRYSRRSGRNAFEDEDEDDDDCAGSLPYADTPTRFCRNPHIFRYSYFLLSPIVYFELSCFS
jgi:hypothetical protein